MEKWHDKRVLVLGAGDTGVSVVRWVTRLGARVRVADSRHDPPGFAELAAQHPGVDVVGGPFSADLFGDAELVVASPGVAIAGPACDPAIAAARAQGKAFVGDVELFAWEQNALAKAGKRAKMLAITGTNGKSTVTAMAGAMCRAAGLDTVVAGNIGVPVLEAALAARTTGQPDLYVLELSSFQLETTAALHCDAAAMLNLTEDHLDRYATLADYARAKQRIFLNADHQVLNRDDAASLAMRDAAKALTTFGLSRPLSSAEFGIADEHLCEGGSALLRLDELPLAGLHNAANALAAYALCRAIGLEARALTSGLKGFDGLPHRLARVALIDGVTWYDDSKGTNVGATVAALRGLGRNAVLIAGGVGKQQDFAALAAPVRENVRAVVLIGRDAPLIEQALATTGVPLHRAATMHDAVRTARRCARRGDAVLLSPACASFDMFKNYHHRGQVFAEAVRALGSDGGAHAV
jgi:UDP-N-acetylmuramoylalanine--D-glutamate ligase